MVDWFEVAAKGLVYLAALMAIGAVTVCHALLARIDEPGNEVMIRRAGDGTDRVLRVAALGLVSALLLRAWAHTVSAFGLPDSVVLANLELIAVESRWGGGWQLQLAAGLLLLGTSFISRPRATRVLRVTAILAVCLALPQTGHPAGHPWRVLLHAAHVLGGGIWLGTLAVVLVATPVALRSRLLRAFAPVATTGVCLVGLAGLVMSVSYLGSVSALWTSDYGRELSLKVVAVGVTLGMGAANWRAFHRSGDHQGRLPVIEASMLLVIVALTAWLSETAHP